MKINLYEELKNCGVFPVKNSTANLILSGTIESAALNIFLDHKKYASEHDYFLNKNSLNSHKLLVPPTEQEREERKQKLLIAGFNLNNFTSSSLSSLIKDEVDAAQSEDEDQTMEQISQWLR